MKTYPMWKGNLWNDYKEDYVGSKFWVLSTVKPCTLVAIMDNPEVGESIASENPDEQFAMSESPNLGTAMNLCASICRNEDRVMTYMTITAEETSEEAFYRMRGQDFDAFLKDSGLIEKGFTQVGTADAYRSASEVSYVSKFN